MKPPRGALEALLQGRHADPFSLLGPHAGPEGTFVRAFVPAQYEHIRITPATGMAIVAFGLLAVVAVGKLREKHHTRKD